MKKPKSKTKPKPKIGDLPIETRVRKKNLPRTVFQKGNAVGFKPGQSGSPGGKPKSGEKRLLSKALNIFLNDRAPDEAGKTVGLPVNPPGSSSYHYSWAQILAKRILNLAVQGEAWAVSEISRLTEPVHSRLGVLGFDSEDGEQSSAVIQLEFVTSDGDGRPCAEFLEAHPDHVIDGKARGSPALPASTD